MAPIVLLLLLPLLTTGQVLEIPQNRTDCFEEEYRHVIDVPQNVQLAHRDMILFRVRTASDFTIQIKDSDEMEILSLLLGPNGHINVQGKTKKLQFEFRNDEWTSVYLSWKNHNVEVGLSADLSKTKLLFKRFFHHFDANIMTIVSQNEGPVRLLINNVCNGTAENIANWRVLYHHLSVDGKSFPRGPVNDKFPFSNSFRRTRDMNQYRRGDSSRFEFALQWTEQNLKTQIWKQTSDPTVSASVTGYEAIKESYYGCEWSGLLSSNKKSPAALFSRRKNGDVSFAVGSFTASPRNHRFPGPCINNKVISVEEVFLYARLAPCVSQCELMHWSVTDNGCQSDGTYPCEPCMSCRPRQQFIKTPCTLTSNTQCELCKKCDKDTFAVNNCTETEDTQCQNCTTCASDEFIRSTCSETKDTACETCKKCDKDTFAVNNCTETEDTQCQNCTTCASDEFIRSTCSETKDTACETCKKCDKDSFTVNNCTETEDTQCQNCKTCSDGEFVSSYCINTADTICTKCTVCDGTAPFQIKQCSVDQDTECSSINPSSKNIYFICGIAGGTVAAFCVLLIILFFYRLRRNRTDEPLDLVNLQESWIVNKAAKPRDSIWYNSNAYSTHY